MSPDCVKVSFHYGKEDLKKLMDKLILNKLNSSIYADICFGSESDKLLFQEAKKHE